MRTGEIGKGHILTRPQILKSYEKTCCRMETNENAE
jgi:hypothetical protein